MAGANFYNQSFEIYEITTSRHNILIKKRKTNVLKVFRRKYIKSFSPIRKNSIALCRLFIIMRRATICHQERTIQVNNDALLSLERSKIDIMNEVARAYHEIEELKAKLAKKNSQIKNSHDFQDTLLLQAEKLRYEKEQISQRCDSVMQEMMDRLRVKQDIISQVREQIEKYVKLKLEVQNRNQVLRERLEKRDKIIAGLKTKLTMMSSWTVRSTSSAQIVS